MIDASYFDRKVWPPGFGPRSPEYKAGFWAGWQWKRQGGARGALAPCPYPEASAACDAWHGGLEHAKRAFSGNT